VSADLQELFDGAGRNPPAPTFDADEVLRRARRSHHRRITGAVAAAVVVTLALGAGLASQWNRESAHDPAAPHPTAPAPGSLGRLVFGLNGDVYLADGDGKDRVRIADGREDDCSNYWSEGPVWSPDGRYFIYRGPEDGGDTTTTGCPSRAMVYISDSSGDRITSFPGEGWRVAWSPDSSRVALWVDFGSTLGIYGLDGVRQALLTVPPEGMLGGDFDPVWSLDGGSLLLRGGVEVPTDGSTPRQLPPDDPRSQLQFEYSPDGADVEYISKDGLTVAAADGSQARVLAPIPENYWFGPVWSPKGDRIAFVSTTSGKSADKGRAHELAVLDVASGTVVPLTDLGGDSASNSILKFSPEGDQILFTRTDATGATSLWSVHTDGSDPHRLVAGSDWGDWQTVTPQR
jgi:Tol biopolymer transport system component